MKPNLTFDGRDEGIADSDFVTRIDDVSGADGRGVAQIAVGNIGVITNGSVAIAGCVVLKRPDPTGGVIVVNPLACASH